MAIKLSKEIFMKRFIGILLTFLLVCTQFVSVTFATAAKLVIDSNVEAKAGETVTVNVALVDGVDVKNFSVKNFVYNTSALELVTAEVVEIGNPSIAEWEDGAMAVTYKNAMAECAGTVLKVQFKVKETAEAGTYTITCTSQINKADITVEAGSIVVKAVTTPNFVKGDATGDGKLSVADCDAVFEHVMGRKKIVDPVRLQAADATGDGKLSVADCDAVFEHVMGRKEIK